MYRRNTIHFGVQITKVESKQILIQWKKKEDTFWSGPNKELCWKWKSITRPDKATENPVGHAFSRFRFIPKWSHCLNTVYALHIISVFLWFLETSQECLLWRSLSLKCPHYVWCIQCCCKVFASNLVTTVGTVVTRCSIFHSSHVSITFLCICLPTACRLSWFTYLPNMFLLG